MSQYAKTASLEEDSEQIVFVVDDDESMQVAMTHLFRSMNFHVKVFSTGAAFLGSEFPDIPSCLVLDIRLPDTNGLEFQGVLAKAGIHIPIVFMTGHGDIPMSVKAMKAGAIDFLPKPFRDQDMLDALTRALDEDRRRRNEGKVLSQLRRLFESLTRREREVLSFVISGLMNKEIAHRLQVSEITVKIHRGHMMKKMEARSVADLVRKAEMLGVKRTN
ncbi:response regulator transcription factor [Bradyrhizobium erythrophlei]|uniref:Two component transcriptional regulator, LuxR family n=1 Tax=Bradyrhizobium erythrophlei TaxID=1437360 RepID=A0A1M7UNN6_9BRAD|nr:response regulator [Bradyrhizobium erythrophlei]SHN84507.1 two component transcriptional regulator, LuxR family [Bradyrhizobium erythrophlei]